MIEAEVRSYFLTVAERNQINYGCKTSIDGASTVVTRSLLRAIVLYVAHTEYSYNAVTLALNGHQRPRCNEISVSPALYHSCLQQVLARVLHIGNPVHSLLNKISRALGRAAFPLQLQVQSWNMLIRAATVTGWAD